MTIRNKKILIIIGGGIAAYKSLELIRILRKSNNEIKTILSAMNLSLGMKLENFDPDANPVEKAKKE